MIDYIGQQLGSYHLIQLLAHGSIADIYLGEHGYLKTLFAVKVFQLRLTTSSQLENFLNQVRCVAHLQHPNIVQVLDFGVHDTVPFLVTNYVPNDTLRHRHPHGSVLPLTSVLSYFKDVAAALEYIHTEKLIHRAVKPENMLLGRDNNILLSDFRIALPSQGSRFQNMQEARSSAAYLAPEQIQGNPCPASDQYALAVVVYEWLSGDRPFHGTFIEICSQHMNTPPPSLREKNPVISAAVEEVILIALAKDAHQRFANVQALANALEQATQPVRGHVPLDAAVSPSSHVRSAPESVITPVPSSSPPGSISNLDRVIVTPPAVAHPSQQPPEVFQRRFSRRTILVALAGLSLGGGSLISLVLSLKPRLGTTLFTYFGHSTYVTSVAWSPNGQKIALGGGDGTVQIIDAASGNTLFTLRGQSDVINAVTWSFDGKYIASGSADETVQVWNATNGNRILTYKGHVNTVNAVAWSPDGTQIASGSYDNTAQVWNAANGDIIFTFRGHSDAVWGVTWSPDNKRVASGSFDRTVQVWNASDGRDILIYRGHDAEVHTVAWSPDGMHIASAGFDQAVQVWDAITGRQIYTYHGHSGGVYALAWSPDGTHIASASADRTVQVWNATTGSNAYIYRGHSGYVYTIAWSPDGKHIASGGSDGTMQMWQAV